MNFSTGLVSVSFRPLSVKQIIQATEEASLSAIEWGGDIHVPAGNNQIAAKVAAQTAAANLLIPEYGSYYRIGCQNNTGIDVIVSTARILQCKTIRLWASSKKRLELTDDEYSVAVSDAKNFCAKYPDILFCLECHNNTITENYKDALAYLKDVDCANLKMFWQPNQFRSFAYNLESLQALLPYIRSVHVFAWEGREKLPLSAHADRWAEYLKILKTAPTETMYLMLEFMHDGKVESLRETAEVLHNLVSQYS